MRFTNLNDWLQWQESLHSTEIDMGLSRIREVAQRMALLKPDARVVTVAGTNGKGSCVAMLEALCLDASLSVGAFTSPHFLIYNERIRINGTPVSDELICQSFARIDAAREDISLTYFEFGALAALDVMQTQGVDIMLLEVGLGGRLDAVNIIDADVAVVTSIAVDHEAFLGNDREQIGREKAGIFRADRRAICADSNAPASIAQVAAETGAELLSFGEGFSFTELEGRWSWRGLNCDSQAIKLADLTLPNLPLPSVAAAMQAFISLGFELPLELSPVLQKVGLIGRCQYIESRGRTFILDVAHNPAAAAHLSQKLLKDQNFTGHTLAVVAVMADKDRQGLLQGIKPCVDCWLLSSLPGIERAANAEILAEDLQSLGLTGELFDSVEDAIEQAITESTSADRIVILGSFFTVAAAMQLLRH